MDTHRGEGGEKPLPLPPGSLPQGGMGLAQESCQDGRGIGIANLRR